MGGRIYMEARGSMTRFEPLTEELFRKLASEGPTYSELKDALAAHGLSMEHVVCDPDRKVSNAFYADASQGLYIPLYPNQHNLCEILGYMNIDEQQDLVRQTLADGEWKQYYRNCVPVPMLIYDFQRRYREIPSDQVFSVWYSIYKRIDYSNGMWTTEVLEYVLSKAPPSVLPPVDTNGRVTLYRGMGALSQPAEKAISWMTHPGNALWFAIHCGAGTHLAIAKVRPEDIVFYDEGYHAENKVILRPGTEMELSYEDMIPAEKERVIPMFATAIVDFKQYGPLVKSLGYSEESIFQLHGAKHIQRVLFLSLIYYYNSGDTLTEADKQVLIYFSLLHDIGRTNENKDPSHGEQSVKKIQQQGIRLKGVHLSKKDYRIAELIICCHCWDDQQGIEAIQAAPGLTRKDKERACRLYLICKDMDGLDRVRFNGLDYRMLRTEYARRLPLIAGCLLEEPILEFVNFRM